MNADVLRLTRPYLEAVAWSLPPLLLYFAFRRYLQSVGVVRPIMLTLIAANLLNVVVNWMLIYGRLGAPALGVAGAAWATVLSRVAMVVSLLVVIVVARAPVGLTDPRPVAARAAADSAAGRARGSRRRCS